METGYFRFASLRPQGSAALQFSQQGKAYSPNLVFSTSLVCLFATSAVFLVLMLLYAAPVAGWMGYPDHPNYVSQLAAVIAIDCFTSIPFARLRLQRRAKTFALFKVLNVLFYVGINIVFFTYLPTYIAQNPHSVLLRALSANPDVGYVFFANMLASGFTLVLLLPTVFSVRIRISTPLLKRMLIYSLPLLVAGLPGIANDYIDRVLFRHLVLSADAMQLLGVYGANAKLAVLMVIFVQMFRYAAEPFFFANASGGADKRALFADMMKYFVIAAVGIFLVVTLWLDVFVLFMGKDFREGADIVPVMLFANLLLGITFNLSIWYKLSGRTSMAVYITLTGLVITVLANIIFVPHFGYRAAALAHVVSNIAMVALSWHLGQKYYPVPYNVRTIGSYIGLGLLLYAIFLLSDFLFHFEPTAKIVVGTLLLLVYAVTAWRRERRKYDK
jgi:O-antigen/teichoic acid export membrane protein